MKLGEVMQHADVQRVRVKVIKDDLPRGFVDYMPETFLNMLDRYGGCRVRELQIDGTGIVATIEVE